MTSPYHSSNRTHLYKYRYTGITLASKIKPDESVLDVGCGPNPFKELIPNLVGIDPTNDSADVLTTLEAYMPSSKFDVALCLGSFRYGSRSHIENMISHLTTLLNPKARIYWRCRTASTGCSFDGRKSVEGIEIFAWTEEDHRVWSAQFGFGLVDLKIDLPGDPLFERIYAEWSR